MWEGQIKMISDSAKTFDGVKSEIFVPKYANHVPSLKISWDSKKVKITPNQFRHELESVIRQLKQQVIVNLLE